MRQWKAGGQQIPCEVSQMLPLPGSQIAEGLQIALRACQTLSLPGWQKDLHPTALLPEASTGGSWQAVLAPEG